MEIEKKDNPEMRDEEELKRLLIHSMKELGEIAEIFVKKDIDFDHWKNELGDLCTFGIKPMLELAGFTFEKAIEIGLERKMKKIQKIRRE